MSAGKRNKLETKVIYACISSATKHSPTPASQPCFPQASRGLLMWQAENGCAAVPASEQQLLKA